MTDIYKNLIWSRIFLVCAHRSHKDLIMLFSDFFVHTRLIDKVLSQTFGDFAGNSVWTWLWTLCGLFHSPDLLTDCDAAEIGGP